MKTLPVPERVAQALGILPVEVRKYHVQGLLRRLGVPPAKRTKAELLRTADTLLKQKKREGNDGSKTMRKNGGMNRVETVPIPKDGKIVIIQRCSYPGRNHRTASNANNKSPRPTKTKSSPRSSPPRAGPPPPPPPPRPPAPRPPPPPKPPAAPKKSTEGVRSARNELMHSIRERFRTNNKLRKRRNMEEVYEGTG